MKAVMVGAAAVVLLASVCVSSAFGERSNPPGGNAAPGISQPTDSGSVNPAVTGPHYELQYHYRGRQARWVREWVFVR